jgi:hypothetical protein
MKHKSKHLKAFVLAVLIFPHICVFAQENNEGWTVFPAGQAEYSYISKYPGFTIKCPDGWSYAQRELNTITPDDPSRAVFTKELTENIPGHYNPSLFIALIPVKEPLTLNAMSQALKSNMPSGQTIMQGPVVKEVAGKKYIYCSSKNTEESIYTETYDFIGEGNILIRIKVLCMISDLETIKDDIKKSIGSIKLSTAAMVSDNKDTKTNQ